MSELTAIGLASILVPFPHSMDDHQALHAKYLEKARAAICIAEKDLTAERLKETIGNLQNNRSQLLAMSTAARQLEQRDATEKITEALLKI